MLCRVAADFMIALHLAAIVFGVTGSFLAWRWRRVIGPHLTVSGRGSGGLSPLPRHGRIS
ncbi:MAG TPA: DUF2784 family protein [Frankiaceae bacterium]|nr:DUF2784 family protein [Frankiaceae bacterium]